MKILFIAPLPPPVNGQSVVSERLLRHLREKHDVSVVDIRKQSLKDGIDSVGRILEVLGIIRKTARQSRGIDVVYMTIAESLAGNLKDLVLAVLRDRRSRLVLHLHGGTIRRHLYDRNRVVLQLNKWIFGRAAAVIISGPSHRQVFEGIVPDERVHIAANYADDALFTTQDDIAKKFESTTPVRLIYVSHMTEGKGYRRLLDAYLSCSAEVKAAITIDFAGAFDEDADRESFVHRIANEPQLHYHGVVTSDQKNELFRQAHVFCLPTAFLEGQPISILEAYASGCVVIATPQPGILDIFTPGENGEALDANTGDGIARVLERLVQLRDLLGAMASRNLELAERQYRAAMSMSRVASIIDGAS